MGSSSSRFPLDISYLTMGTKSLVYGQYEIGSICELYAKNMVGEPKRKTRVSEPD